MELVLKSLLSDCCVSGTGKQKMWKFLVLSRFPVMSSGGGGRWGMVGEQLCLEVGGSEHKGWGRACAHREDGWVWTVRAFEQD